MTSYQIDANESLHLDRLIAASRNQGEITHLRWLDEAADAAEDYLATCDGYEDSARNSDTIEAWGEDWRVHLTLVTAADL